MLTYFSGELHTEDERYELSAFINMLSMRNVGRFAHIGAGNADLFYAVMHSLHFGSYGVVHAEDHTHRAQIERVIVALAEDGRKVGSVYGPSITAATRTIITARGPYDAIMLGNATIAEWEYYRGLAPIIGFYNLGAVQDVWEHVQECGFRTYEFLARGSKLGIGCAWPNISTR